MRSVTLKSKFDFRNNLTLITYSILKSFSNWGCSYSGNFSRIFRIKDRLEIGIWDLYKADEVLTQNLCRAELLELAVFPSQLNPNLYLISSRHSHIGAF